MTPANRNLEPCYQFCTKIFHYICLCVCVCISLKLITKIFLKKHPFQEKSPRVTQKFPKDFPYSTGNRSTNQRKIPPEIPLGNHGKQKQFTVHFEKLKMSSLVMVLIKLPAEEKASEDQLSHLAYSGTCIYLAFPIHNFH